MNEKENLSVVLSFSADGARLCYTATDVRESAGMGCTGPYFCLNA